MQQQQQCEDGFYVKAFGFWDTRGVGEGGKGIAQALGDWIMMRVLVLFPCSAFLFLDFSSSSSSSS